jgi:hypothetical protein
MLTRSPLEIEIYADMQAQDLERRLRSRRPEWYGSAGPQDGPSLRRGVGRWLISAGTWISGSSET